MPLDYSFLQHQRNFECFATKNLSNELNNKYLYSSKTKIETFKILSLNLSIPY